MKKSIFLLAAAAAAFASCTQNEVMEVAENRTIGFSPFVGNTTRADVTTDNISTFWVFGDYSNTNWVDVFNNVKVSKNGDWASEQLAYWQVDKNYNFGAYADGTTNLVTETGVKYDPANNTLTFTSYTAGGNDLIAATATDQSWNGSGDPDKVSFTFDHMLSKIVFTFKTNAADTYKMKVTNLKINNTAIKTATGTYTTVPAWNTADNTTTGEYVYGQGPDYVAIEDYADGTMGADGYFSKTTDPQYVIPQSNTSLTASFTVTVYDNNGTELCKRDFSGISLRYTANSLGTDNTWTAGYVYNYIATINPDDVSDTLKPIEFTVSSVDTWEPSTDTDLSTNP